MSTTTTTLSWLSAALLTLAPLTLAAEMQLPSAAEEIQPLLIGEKVPAVTLRLSDGTDIDLHEQLAEKPTLLIAHRGGWCPFCTRHLSELVGITEEIREHGFQIIAFSPDSPETLFMASEDIVIPYLELSDNDLRLATGLGIAFRVPQDTVDLYKNEYGIDLEGDSGRTHHGVPVPAAYLIDTDGTIVFSYINPNYRIRVPGSVVLSAAEAYAKGWRAGS